ncbi:MAG: peptide deformylase [Nitrospina sp.]|jgi:peptide deformylase|nr:peptide deformylase [Nitrospina sp.]MBT3510193.1 peptide deformylase [Nitrospina sp.]MBT3876839.1 peptide deformylase [Nitrospina sp.]MBT4556881.1 peptide deformylase [Nitrospina sp.]MBT5349693.1 peptide deformylase [Nitrospina sp.]
MALLDILVYPDERLKKISQPVKEFSDNLKQFILNLEETFRSFPGCVGIAAPQVGRFERVVLVDISHKPQHENHGFLILVNPKISSSAGSNVGREGCLSVPDYTGKVERSVSITLEALNEKGEKKVFQMKGYEARAVQHEIDHLDGKLFLDRLVSRRNALSKRIELST